MNAVLRVSIEHNSRKKMDDKSATILPGKKEFSKNLAQSIIISHLYIRHLHAIS